ncbi:MAG: glycosyltransferase family 39 protein, partial [Polyangiaceae bacterium]
MTGSTALERLARAVAFVACTWFAFTAFWGLFSIPGGGHLGAGSAGNVMAAEQMLKWHIFYPAWDWYNGQPPPKVSYICHHPFGQYWIPAVFLAVFGHRDFVVRLVPALMSAAIPPMLYGIAKEKWGRSAGAVAAASYVVVPIAVGFSQFLNLETFCIFGALLFFWGHTRHMVTGKRRHLAASLVGMAFACSGDWAGYMIVGPMLAWALLRAYVLPVRLTPRFQRIPYARWWALSVAIAMGSALLWIYLFYDAGQLNDWIGAAQNRGGAEGTKLRAVLDARKNWIDFSFTPLAILLGKIAAPLCLLRLLVTRRDEETYSLSLLVGGAAQYVVFKQGADVHIFWPHYFAAYFALAMAQMARTLGAVAGFVVRRFSWRLAGAVASWVTIALGLIPAAAMTRDGVMSLWVWRRTGGRYDENGGLIRSHLDMLRVLELVVNPVTIRGTPIDTHVSANWGWEHLWKYQGLGKDANMPLS